MTYIELNRSAVAAILLSCIWGYEDDEMIAKAVIDAEKLVDYEIMMNKWNNAAWESRFHSKWFAGGDPKELMF